MRKRVAKKRQILQFLADRIRAWERAVLLNAMESWHLHVCMMQAVCHERERTARLWQQKGIFDAWRDDQRHVAREDAGVVGIELVLQMDFAEAADEAAFKRAVEIDVAKAVDGKLLVENPCMSACTAVAVCPLAVE